jgi:hypothetical protein
MIKPTICRKLPLVFFALLLSACSKESKYTGRFNFTVIENSWGGISPETYYSNYDTIEFSGSVRTYKKDTLKIKYLKDCVLYCIIDENGQFIYGRREGYITDSYYPTSGGFKSEDELDFSFHTGGIGGGIDYNVTGVR